MKVKFWGVRGSLPTPLKSTEVKEKLISSLKLARYSDLTDEKSINTFVDSLPLSLKGTYGGNTSCIQIIPDNNDVYIIDCGTGLKALGMHLMASDFAKGKGRANIFMSHTHWDHIQGIPFFIPLFIKGNKFTFYSPIDHIKEKIEYQQDFTHFPINLEYMMAEKEFVNLPNEGEFYLNGVKIYNKKMRHPGDAFGFRFEEKGKTICYTSDCEFNIDELNNILEYQTFFQNADVVIFDAQYTFSESINKIDWGHSSAPIAIDIAARYNVKKLILFHHDPEYNDDKIDAVLANAKSYVAMNLKKKNINMEIETAAEGMEIEV